MSIAGLEIVDLSSFMKNEENEERINLLIVSFSHKSKEGQVARQVHAKLASES